MVRHVALTLRIPAAMHEQLRRDAFEQRTSITQLVIEAIRERPTKRYDDDFGDEAGRLAAEARRRGEHVSNRSRLGVAGECDYLDCTERWTHSKEGGAPSRFCSKHPTGTENACRPCGDARRAREDWDAEAKKKATTLPEIRRPETCTVHAEYPLPCPRCKEGT